MATDLTPAMALAQGFAAQAQRWAVEHGAAETGIVRRAALLVSMAVSSGDVCAHLDELVTEFGSERLRAALMASGIVGTPEARAAMPLILDANDRLYLHRYFDYESRLARNLAQRDGGDAEIVPGIRARLRELFAANDEPVDWQKIAVAMALLGRLTIISGGPGTGKTTTLVNLLACLLEQDPRCRIALAAPTGKAAARMTDAIRQRASHLPAELQTRLPNESFTLHRLLGATPATGEFRHHARHPLPIDALVVDEASMLDLALATKLFEAVPRGARIILLGDKDQLSAVESGAVFAELSADPRLSERRRDRLAELCALPPEAIRPPAVDARGGLQDCVVWLTRNFRFASDSGIGELAREVNGGDATAAIDRLRNNADVSISWMEEDAERPSDAAMQHIHAGYGAYLEALRDCDITAIFAAFGRFRTLCAVREGPRGVEALNHRIGEQLRLKLDHPLDPGERSEWYPGRPVMVLRNDTILKLFNGDIGIVLPDAEETLMVYFPDGEAGFRSIAPVRLPEHETAFAMTIHKSQGSEFDAVLVMLPANPNRVLTRELVYTAITRARSRMTLVGGEAILVRAIQSVTRRHSGLAARLGEASAVLAPPW